MSVISTILVLLVASLASMEGILDEFQLHQPSVVYTLIGLAIGSLEAGIVPGGILQVIVSGWANIGAAVAPDVALASVASAVILVLGGQGAKGVPPAIAIAVPLAVAGLLLTMTVWTVAVPTVHMTGTAAEKGNIRQVEVLHIFVVCLQGIRIAIPVDALLFTLADTVRNFLESMPAWLTDGIAIGGGMAVAAGYTLVTNMMAIKEVWPPFIIGFVVAVISQLTLIASDALGIALTLTHLNLFKMDGSSSSNGGGNSGNPLGDILNDY